MQPESSLFDQAAEKLREAMGPTASGTDRMRLIQEALTLYHLHQSDDLDVSAGALGRDAAGGA